MRTTKALLCAAALAAGAVTSMAQSNVYSLNVVGYINVPLTNGFNLIANQLDLDGTMTNNTLQTVFGTNLPPLSQVVAYSGGYVSATWSGTKWSGNTNVCNAALNPGGGVYLKLPAGAVPAITFVGNVIQGTNVMQIAQGYQIVSAIPPMSGGVQTVLGYKPTTLDKVVQFNGFPRAFSSHVFSSGTTWSAGEPNPAVAEAFWLNAKVATNWVQAFTVQ